MYAEVIVIRKPQQQIADQIYYYIIELPRVLWKVDI